MSIEWFRSWHGAPTDPKWLGIARRAGVATGIAAAVAWALMDRASQAEDRGSIAGYDPDGLGCFFGCEPEQVDAIVAAMGDKGMICDGRFTAWEKRQPKREDNSADRVRKHRDVTQCNAVKRNVTVDKDTDTDSYEPNGSLSERGSDEPVILKKTRKKKDYTADFERFWADYPTDQNMSKWEAFEAWGKLSDIDRRSAHESLPSFRAYCEKNTDYRPVHAVRYLKNRRFEGHATAAKVAAVRATINPSSPSWNAWKSHFRDKNQNRMASLMDKLGTDGRGFVVETEWPPGHP